eukprot:5106104-Prymnesium_polylepis.1
MPVRVHPCGLRSETGARTGGGLVRRSGTGRPAARAHAYTKGQARAGGDDSCAEAGRAARPR